MDCSENMIMKGESRKGGVEVSKSAKQFGEDLGKTSAQGRQQSVPSLPETRFGTGSEHMCSLDVAAPWKHRLQANTAPGIKAGQQDPQSGMLSGKHIFMIITEFIHIQR